MNSLLTRERPDIWNRGLALATSLTSYEYAPKLPLPDGTIYACGVNYIPETDAQKRKRIRDDIRHYKREIKDIEQGKSNDLYNTPTVREDEIKWRRERIRELEKTFEDVPKARVFVPPGAMEWLLHEAGHYVASTPEECLLPNYGLSPSEIGSDGEREWQAWAFEEIILAPFGPAREFAPPTQRDGAAFSKAGPMPDWALWHVERRIRELSIDVEAWRVVWGEWIRYERGLPVPSWRRES